MGCKRNGAGVLFLVCQQPPCNRSVNRHKRAIIRTVDVTLRINNSCRGVEGDVYVRFRFLLPSSKRRHKVLLGCGHLARRRVADDNRYVMVTYLHSVGLENSMGSHFLNI